MFALDEWRRRKIVRGRETQNQQSARFDKNNSVAHRNQNTTSFGYTTHNPMKEIRIDIDSQTNDSGARRLEQHQTRTGHHKTIPLRPPPTQNNAQHPTKHI
jgi:hypothetical protein